MITILGRNSKFFSKNEDVKLEVEIKNVKKITINIYEMNLESYYRKKLKPFEDTISLEGIIPALVQEVEINGVTSIVKSLKTFNFPEIKEKKRGLFIIDFIGGGISSRAVIRKGSLTFL